MHNSYLTTSWDDGHPLDLRLAERLHKYGVPATFYVPLRNNTLPVMTVGDIRELSNGFEVGGHTMNHVDLLRIDDETARREITSCKDELEEITSAVCRSFCFPKGHFSAKHVQYVREAGFSVARTVETMSISEPRVRNELIMLATTIQANPTRKLGIARNVLKRVAVRNAAMWMLHRKSDWTATAEALLDYVAGHGGVFHLWGHSWEIDESRQWVSLDRVLAAIAERKSCFHLLTNADCSSVI